MDMEKPEALYDATITSDDGHSFSISGISYDGVNLMIDNKKAQTVFTSIDRRGNITIIDFAKVAFIHFTKRNY